MPKVDPIIVNVGFKEDASVQDVMGHLSTVKQTMEDISSVDGKPSVSSVLDSLGLSEDNKADVSRILQTAYDSIDGLGKGLTEVPSHLSSAFGVLKTELTAIEQLLNNTYSHYEKIGQNSTHDLQTAQRLMMSVASIQSAQKAIQTGNALMTSSRTDNSLGWSTDTFMKYAPHIARDKIEPMIRTMRASNKHGTTYEGIINTLMSSTDFTGMMKHLMKEEGVDIQRKDIDSIIEQNAKAIIQSYTPHAIASSTVDTLSRWRETGRIKTLETAATPQQRLLNDYQRKTFNTYGQSPEVIKAASEYIRTHGGNPTRNFSTQKEREQSGLQDFYNYLSQGNNMAALFPLLHEAGIVTDGGKHGNYQAYPKIRETQLQYLLARTLQEYNNALDSDPVYGIDSSNIMFADKAAGRQGKQPSLYLGLARSLKDVIPSITAMTPGAVGGGKLFETDIRYGKAPSPNRYYIPQTEIDFTTGQAAVRDLNWRKPLEKGIEERDDDELVAITDSIGARMFGLKGNRTLGLGRDDKTGEIIRTDKITDTDHIGRKRTRGLPILTADFGKFVTQDENGKYVIDTDHPEYKKAARIIGGEENLKYGGEEYTYLAQHENGNKVIFGNTKMMKDLEAKYKEAHLPTPFGYGEDTNNAGFFEGDPVTTMKVSNYLAKMFSSGTPIEELYPESTKELKNQQGVYANFEMLYDILGVDKDSGRRMDGLVYGDPRYFKKDMQARYGLGTAKFMLTAQDWRPMLMEGFEASAKENPQLFRKVETGRDANNKPIYDYQVLAPTGGANAEDRPAIEAYIKGTPYIDASGRQWTEDELREQYFVNIMSKDAPFLMDRTAVKAPTGFRTLSIANYKGKYGPQAYNEAVKQGRVNTQTGQVRLLPKQQGQILKEFSNEFDRSISGFVEMKDEENLSSQKGYMPESILRAIGAPMELFEESERRYKEKLDELNTTSGRIKQFQNDAAAMEKINNNPAWVWESKEANTHIEETRRALEYHRAVHDVLMHEDRETVPGVGTVGQLAEIYQGFTKIPDKEYGKFASMLPKTMEENNAIWSKGISSSEIDMLGRFPFASGQYLMDVKNYAQMVEVDDYLTDLDKLEKANSELKNAQSRKNPDINKIKELTEKRDKIQGQVDKWNEKITNNPKGALAFAAALKENGRDPRDINSMIMTASQMYTMNTGDFDGDTVNAFIHMGETAEVRAKVKENARKNKEDFEKGMAISKQANSGSTQPVNPELAGKSLGDLRMLNLAQSANASSSMAQASAALRKAQSADANTPDRIAAIVESMIAYDQATSGVKKKAETFQMGGHAYSFLTSQGQHYERFIRGLYKAKNAQTPEEEYGRNIFGVSAASMADPEGVFAMSARKHDLEKHGIMDLSSLELMENWYDKTFGVEQTAESKAARFYLDKMEDNLIWSRLWTDQDVRSASDLHKKWGSELEAKRLSGNYPTHKLKEETERYEAFGKRIEELNSGKFATVSTVQKEAQKYREMASENPAMAATYGKYADYLEDLLPKEGKEKSEADKVRDAIINGDRFTRKARVQNALAMAQQDTNDEENQRRAADLRAALIQDAVYGRSNSTNADRSIYNWSSVKHYQGNGQGEAYVPLPEYSHVDLSGAFDAKGLINPASIQREVGKGVYYSKGASDLAFFEKDLINTIMGHDQSTSAYKNAWTHIGTLMHNAFERVHDPEKLEKPEDAITDLRKAFLGEVRSPEVEGMLKAGLRFVPKSDGTLHAVNAPGTSKYTTDQLRSYEQHVNDLLGGSFNNILKVFDAYSKTEGEKVSSIEDRLYDKTSKKAPVRYGGNIYRQVVTDEDGNIIRTDTALEKKDFAPVKEGETSHIFQTHAKPDEVRTMKSGLKHIYDYKSGDEGSLESLPQSAFYASLFVDLAKRYHSLAPGDSRRALYEPYKDWVQLGKNGKPLTDAAGEFIPAVGLLTGISPKVAGSYDTIDLRTPEGMQWYKNRVGEMNKAFLNQEARGKNNFNAGLQLLDDAKRKATEDVMSAERIATATDQDVEAFKQRKSIGNQSELYLATYAQNKERLKELESDIYKEHNKDRNAGYIPQDRFTRRRNELMEMFSVEQQAAMLMHYENEDAARAEIQKIGERRNLALELNEQDAFKASLTDIGDAQTRARRMLEGVAPATSTNTVLGAYRAIREAGRTREHLKEDETYFDKETGKFRVNDADAETKRIAKQREKQYNEAEKKSQEAEQWLVSEVDTYISKYETKENKKISALTAMAPEDPLTAFNNFTDKKREELETQIKQYNENVKEYEKTLEDKSLSPDQRANFERLKTIDESHAKQLQDFMDNGSFAAKNAADRQRELGLVTQTPQQRNDQWRNERITAIDAELAAVALQRRSGVLSDTEADRQTRELRARRNRVNDEAMERLGNEMFDRRTTFDAFEMAVTGNTRSNAEQAQYDRMSLWSKISQAKEKLGDNDPLKREYERLLDNYDLFDEYERNRRTELNTQSFIRAEASRRSHIAFESQMTGDQLTPEQYASIQTSAVRSKNIARQAELEKALRNTNLSADERRAYEDELHDITNVDYRTVRGRFLREGNQNQRILDLQRHQKTASLDQLFTGVQSLDDAVDYAVENAALQIEEAIKALKLNKNQAAAFRRRYSNTEKIREEATEQYGLMLRGEELSTTQQGLGIEERLNGRRGTPTERANIAVLAMRRDIAAQRNALLKQARRRGASEAELEAIRNQWNPEMDLTDYQNRMTQQEQYAFQSFTARQEQEGIKTGASLENRSLSYNELLRANQARLRAERDNFIQQQMQNGLMTEAQARAYESRYNDTYLGGIALQQANYEYGQRDLSLGMESRQLEATLSGRALTRQELVDQRRDQLIKQAREHAEKLRRERGEQAATDFWSRHSYADISRQAEEEVLNQFMYGNEANQNQLYAHQIQNDAALRQQQYSAEDFLRQQRNRHMRGAIAMSLQPFNERRISLQRNVQNYRDQRDIAQREVNSINNRLRDTRLSEQDRAKLETQRDLKLQDIGKYNSQISQAGQEIEQLSSVGARASAVFMGFGDVLGRLATRLGRQLFHKALNEAKKFVQEFNRSMTSIQMITLKTDDQMATLGDGLIEKAKELKISISEITQSAETLYRQGLSDQEVNERLDVISKFSKVSGTKVDAATKLITVAMNTGLVSDPQTAADIVTALGDNAATNASEIEKGIEKAGAAAAADGTTFAELAAMLTAITSTTQIGGNVAGRTLNTIFGRMNKIGTNELIYDENGHAISGSAVAKLLAAQGISQYDENGKKRSSYDTLYALSQRWDKMSDAEQQQIANAIAGTRQYSNFAAIMQGMSEGKVDEYMSLAGTAEGIVDQKYEIYAKSLQASLTDLKNTFDELVNDLTDTGALTGLISTITGMIKGIDNLTNSFGGLGAMLTTVIPMLAGIMLLKTGMSTANIGLIAAGAGAMAIGGIVASNAGNQVTEEDRYKNSVKLATERYEAADSQIERAKTLQEKGSNRTAEETLEYTKLISSLANMFNLDDPTKSVDEFTNSLDSVSAAASNAAKHSQEYADVIEQADKENETERIRNAASTSSGWASTSAESLTKYRNAQNKSSVMDSKYLADFFVTDEEGNQTIDIQKFFNVAGLGFSNTIEDGVFQQGIGGALNNWESIPILGDFIDWATPGVRKAVGKSQDQLEYSWNKNAPRLAQLLSDAMSSTAIMDKDMFAQLQEAGYTGYTTDDWLKYLNDIHSGKRMSTLPIQMLKNAMDSWSGNNTIAQGSKEQIKSDFKSQIKTIAPWLEEDQVEAMANQAAEDVIALEATGQNTSTAYGSVLGNIFNFGSNDYSPDSVKNAANAYLAKTGYKGQEPVEQKKLYRGQVYETQKAAVEAQKADYETYKAENKIDELSYVEYGERSYQVGKDEEQLAADMAADRQAAIDAQVDSLVEGSYKTGHLWHGQIRSPEELSGMFLAYQASEGHGITDQDIYSYTDANGKTTTSINWSEVDKARQTDYLQSAIAAASNAGEFSRIISENKPEDIADAVLEWYESQWGNPTYDDFAESHRIGTTKGFMYNGTPYTFRPDADKAQMDDFWAEVGEEQGYYEIDGKRYTSKSEALVGGRAYLEKKWNEEHKIGEAEGVVTYNGQQYESVEAAEAQRQKDFYEASENAITAATEEEEEALDVLHAGTTTGLNAWQQDNKNSYALRADAMRRSLEQVGVTDMASLRTYLQGEGATEWKYLTQNNGEFARLVDSIQYDAEGNVINPEVYDQVMTFLRTNGRDLGAPVRTATEKATMAQGMFEHLVGKEKGYLSIEEARDAAQTQYETEQAAYEAEIQRLTDERVSSLTGVVTDETRAKYEAEVRKANPYTGKTANQIAAGYHVYTEEEKGYLKEAVGEQMYDRLINGNASAEEITYARQMLGNRAVGLTSLTTSQQLSGLKTLREEISKGRKIGEGEGDYQTTIASQYLNGWSGAGEYLALLSAKGTDKFEELGGQERLAELEQSLDNFQKNTEIKFNIEGVQQLEEAGKVAEGTAAKLERLQKGGDIAIKVSYEIQSEAYSTAQLGARLNNGTRTEQLEAIKSITGYSDAQIEKMGFDAALADANALYGSQNNLQIASLEEYYKAATTDEERALIDRIAHNAGYINAYDDRGIMLNGRYKLGNNAVDRESGFANAQQLWTGSDIAAAQALILSGDLTASTSGKEDLYSAAASKMGEQATEYMRMKQAGTYSEDELAAQLAKANAEVSASAIKATQEDLQKDLELSSDKYIRDHAQEIAQNRTTLTTGSNAEQLSLYSQFLGNQRSLVGAQYALTNYTGLESASTLASYLSMDEKDVRASLSTDEGRESIKSAIEEKTKNMYSMMAKSVTNDFDFDSETGDLSDLKTSLLEAANKTTGEARDFLLNLANSISDAGDLIGQSDASFSEEYDKVMAQFGDAQQKRSGYDWLRNNFETVAQQERRFVDYQDKNGQYIPGGVERDHSLGEMLQRASNNPQMAKLLSEHPELVAGMNLYDQGNLNGAQFNSLVDYAQYGTMTPQVTDAIMQGLFADKGMLDASGYFNIPNTDEEAERLIQNLKDIKNAGDGTSEMLDILFEQYPDLKSFFETGDKNKAAEALKEVNSQITSDKVNQAAKYTKSSKNIAEAMAKIKKGGKDAAEGYAMLRENSRDRVDQMTAVMVNAKDKKGNYKAGSKLSDETRNVIASAFDNIDADDLKDYTAQQMEELLEGLPDYLNEQLVDDLNAGIEGMHIPVDLSGVTVDGDGYVDLTSLQATLDAVDADIYSRLKAMIEAQGGEWGSVKFKIDEKTGQLVVVSADTKFNKKGGYSKGGSGKSSGGGGGKSAAQTAIDAAKHYVSEAQHYTTMAESDLYHPDKINDFSAYAGAVQANVFTLMQEGQVYQDMIDYLEEQRASVSEGTDDWWDLTEAINGYKESLAKLEEQIDSVNQKLLEEAKEEYGYKITANQHEINMTTTDRTFYQRTNDYDAELASIDQLNIEYGALEETYREAIAMYKALQANVEEGSDQWWEYQQEIDTTTESLAELKNTIAALNAEKLSIIIEKQTNQDKPENNAYSLMDLYKTRYLNTEDYTAYETIMSERKTLLQQSISSNAAQILELENLLSTFEEGSDEWISTRDEIWNIKLDTATKENEYIELEKELAEQRLAQVSQAYDRATAYENHANTMYDTYGGMYKSVSNYAGYRSTLREQISMFENLQASATQARDAALEQMASLQKGTPEWYNARDAVYEYEEAIASAYASTVEKKYAIEESLANELIESYDNDMSLFDQRAKIIESEKKKYDNANDYAGYMAMMAKERDVWQEQQDSRQDYLAQLQHRLENTTIGTDAWKNLRKEILTVEQAIASADVTLANFENDLEKTKLDYYVEKMDRAQADRTHALTMIQYEETKYQNAGQLSNYGIMLEKENEVREKDIKSLQRDLELLEEELEGLEKGSKQYQRVIDLIKKKEEAIQADSNAIEKNNKLLEENQNKIIQTRKTLEDQVDAEIKKRKEQEKVELNATVNLQNNILNVVKQRYKDEWDIMKQDQQKKKEALSKEKELINDRLEARKKAMDTEDKYEELRDLQNQLALISSDPTRSKDAKELSKRIADIRKDISWDRAAEEAQTATERIDDEIRAMDEWIQINEENLTYMLEDAHNFADEVNDVLSGSYEDIVTWMMDNNTEFKNSLDETQQQMINGWETTWKTMHGIVDTYWDQINDILSSKDNFIKFMQESVDYITASEAGKATMLYAWSKGYDAMTGAEQVDEAAEDYQAHSHEEDVVGDIADEIAKAMEEATKWTYDADWWTTGITPDADLLTEIVEKVKDYSEYGLPEAVGSAIVPTIEEFMDQYEGYGLARDETPPSQYAQVNVGQYTAKTDTSSYKTTSSSKKSSTSTSTSKGTTSGDDKQAYTFTTTDTRGYTTSQGGTVYASSRDEAMELASQQAAVTGRIVGTLTRQYASGGLVDYTGPAWVDGTKAKPEAFLSSYDTEQIGKLTEILRHIWVAPGYVPSTESYGNNTSIGDIVININQAELKSDADYEEVARRVGAAFTKQLSKEGLNLAGYAF